MPEAIRVLIADDEPLMRIPLSDSLRRAGYEVKAASTGDEAIAMLAAEPFDVAVIDLRMPGADGLSVLREMRRLGRDTDAVVITAYGTIDAAVEAMKLGARDFLTKPFETAALVGLIDRYAKVRAASRDDSRIERMTRQGICCGMVGVSRAMGLVFNFIDTVADTDATVLVRGETGTGKELVAEAIHARSPRRDRPLIKVNCAAIPGNLIESELFGHERGAFTGADRKKVGKFEAAQGGTLFLDEVDEMPIEAQAKVLRAIQEREIERLGSVETIRVDARIVAATKRDLHTTAAEGRFREDLFYRLNVLPLALPPLRERHGDVTVLAAHFLAAAAGRMHRPARAFSKEAAAALDRHDYPGNVRELKNVVERAVALCPGDTVETAHLGDEFLPPEQPLPPAAEPGTLADAVRDAEMQRIEEALKTAGGSRSRAAGILGISRKTLWEKLKKRPG
ncbi:MAG: sigma-54-dependent Fis family transcriptional regulator [Deltaproteobacteria bacterium]|nr:sigma-54-dependent Fis family transcriptional regulator [Deltaproteobacteria bacterium]